MQQHERKEPGDFRIGGRSHQSARQPDCFGGQVDVARVPLVEHQVQHMHDRGQIAGLIKPDRRNRPLGSADALGHRCLGHEIGHRDLPGRQPTQRPQGQRHRRRRGEDRMRTQGVKPERVIRIRYLTGGRFSRNPYFATASGRLGPGEIDE